ncbi:permease prefix domain 1-containing protein [Enterocloster lavalensis]|uniref:permease prefix domain 1-containing protein n=1 Tax=Enterocloster lavalensis TaxID=460384 RepID=UPI0023EFF630|nr:permease prefix domain 1-containing protein [Enterocloster lavalensis]
MEMHEYLDALSGQIRSGRARQAVREELEAHILDQAQAYADSGMEEQEALEQAVRQMGDPVEVGIDMDRIHRPRNGWKYLGIIAVLSAAGLLAQYICIYRFGGDTLTGNSVGIQAFYRQCAYTLTGLAVMAGLYFCDYSLLSRYAKPAGALFIAVTAVVCMPGFAPVVAGAHAYLKVILYMFIPLYGGILYRYRGSGIRGYVCALFWLGAAAWLALCRIRGGISVTIDVLFVCALLLVLSLYRNWYGIRRRALPAAATCALAACLGAGVALNLSDYQLRRLEVILNPRFADRAYGYQTDVAREIAGRLKLVGGQMPERTPIHRLPGVQYDYALLQTASVWGWLAAGVLLAILALFLVSLFIMVKRQKNQLGQMIGFGCAAILALESARYLLYNLGLGLMPAAGLPFLTYGRLHTVAVYALFGILLSIYRYQDLIWETGNHRKSQGRGMTWGVGKYRIYIERADS